MFPSQRSESAIPHTIDKNGLEMGCVDLNVRAETIRLHDYKKSDPWLCLATESWKLRG